jgi:ubiquinone/menaquinone biosynthesis C-methylase UbiE
MNWKYKATLQSIFSIIPFGEYMNYVFQTKITRNLPVKETKFKEKLLLAQKHLKNFQKYNSSHLIDCITSTNTLEHIPPNEIKAILKECYRILKKDGILSFQIDYQDHYSYFDKNISVYNFLKFNQGTWNTFFNPSLHYQNRLRHKEYLQLFYESGFNILEDNYYGGTPSDIEQIKTVRINKQFSNYDLNELAIRGTFIVLRKC